MKPRIEKQSAGWAVTQGTLLVGLSRTFSTACSLAASWNDLRFC